MAYFMLNLRLLPILSLSFVTRDCGSKDHLHPSRESGGDINADAATKMIKHAAARSKVDTDAILLV